MRSRMLLALGIFCSCAALAGCSKDPPPSPPFTCDSLQSRAESCAPQTLAKVKAGLAARADHEQQFKMFESRFSKRLSQKQTKAQCEKFQGDKAQSSRVEAMKACHAKPDCDAFASCMLDL